MMNSIGYIRSGTDVYSYQIGESPVRLAAARKERRTGVVALLGVGRYFVYPFGEENLEPNVCARMITDNRLLPELIEKQIRMLYGRGPVLYRQSVDEHGQVSRRYLEDAQILDWLDSWRENGLADDFRTYINKCVRSFYYTEGVFSSWRLSALSRCFW